MAKDNPATRLKTLIREILSVSDGEGVGNAWCDVLRLPRDTTSRSLLLARLSPILSLPLETSEAVTKVVPVDGHKMYLRWVPQVESAFSVIRLDNRWSDVRGPLQHESLSALNFCEFTLESALKAEAIAADDLAELHEQLLDLIEDVTAAKIDDDLRDFVLEHLREIDRSIDDVRFRGAAGLEESTALFIGRAALRPDLGRRLEKSQFWPKVWKVIVRIQTLVNLAHGVAELDSTFDLHLLTPPATEIDSEPIDVGIETRQV